MKFDELESKMRVFETSYDLFVLPEIFMVARIDGRNFTRLTNEIHKFKTPFDPLFSDYMVETTAHLMNSGFRIIFGYTQSDEISLLFHSEEQTFNRKTRKYNSVLAGEASAKFSLLLGDIGSFDCRICQLPNIDLVVDYFRWRNEDATRNALNAYCYWALRDKGKTPQKASKILDGLSLAAKNELLFQERGINFNDVPNWQKRGIGVYWEQYEKEGFNPITEEKTVTQRKRLKVDRNLPMKEGYSNFIRKLIQE